MNLSYNPTISLEHIQ